MQFLIVCPRCHRPTIQTYRLVTPKIAIVETECVSKKCNWRSAFTVPLKDIHNGSPSIAFKLEHYGTVFVA